MLKWTLRNRLLVSFLLLIGVTILMLGSYILWYFHQYNIANLTTHLFTNAQIATQFVQPSLSGPYTKASLDNVVKELSATTNIRITVIDLDGKVLADSWENPVAMDNHLNRPEVQSALQGHQENSIRYSSTLHQNTLYAAVPIYHGSEVVGVLRVASTLAQVENGFQKIQSAILTALLATCFLTMALSIRLSRKYTAPLEAITHTAKQMEKGHLEQRVHVHTGDELELLAHTLNSLASNLEDTIHEITSEKNKLELILEHMDNGVILLDRYGRLTTANRQAASFFQITPAMMGQHTLKVIGSQLLDQAIQQTEASRESRFVNIKTTLQENRRIFQVFLAPVRTGVLAVFHDITALQELQERQSEFIANASHELATPLTSIKGFAETLLDGALEDKELRTKFVRIILEEAERMHRLTQSLLQLAKLKAPEYRQQLPMEPLFLIPVLEQVLQEISPKQKAKQLQVHVRFPEEETSITGNSDYIKQLFLNLLDNSVKYTPENGSITLSYEQTPSHAVIVIEDTGIGIPPHHLPLIFERFYRTDKARSRKEGGSGLGLSIVKFIVDLHGGSIQVRSQVNLGTTFTILLPLEKEKHPAAD